MSIAESIIYTAFVGIALAIVYSSTLSHSGNLIDRLFNKAKEQKHEVKGKLKCATIEPQDIPTHLAQSTFEGNSWTEEKIFQLEKRAIFSKAWIYATHASRFLKAGDYRTFEFAGFSFILILGKDKQLRAFHNVCRHRAYPVTKKEVGSSIVLGCRYHGWSYDTKGKLTKAPEFENVREFHKEANSLWELKMEIRDSLVFVNFDAGDSELTLDLGEASYLGRSSRIGEMRWVADWKVEGNFNWNLAGKYSKARFFLALYKLTKLAQGLCIQTSKPEETLTWWPSVLSLRTHRQDWISHIGPNTIVQAFNEERVMISKILPRGPKTTIVECSIYEKSQKRTAALQKRIDELKTSVFFQVQKMEMLQESLPQFSHSVPDGNLKLLKQHMDAEKTLGAEIHPAARKQSFTSEGRADDDLCKQLETDRGQKASLCGANANGLLDW